MLAIQAPGPTLSTRLPPHTHTHTPNVTLTKQYFREKSESPEEKSRQEDVPPQPRSSFYPDEVRGQADATRSCCALYRHSVSQGPSPTGGGGHVFSTMPETLTHLHSPTVSSGKPLQGQRARAMCCKKTDKTLFHTQSQYLPSGKNKSKFKGLKGPLTLRFYKTSCFSLPHTETEPSTW